MVGCNERIFVNICIGLVILLYKTVNFDGSFDLFDGILYNMPKHTQTHIIFVVAFVKHKCNKNIHSKCAQGDSSLFDHYPMDVKTHTHAHPHITL